MTRPTGDDSEKPLPKAEATEAEPFDPEDDPDWLEYEGGE